MNASSAILAFADVLGLQRKSIKPHCVVMKQLSLLVRRAAGNDLLQGSDPLAEWRAVETNGPVAAKYDAAGAERVEAVVDDRRQIVRRPLLRHPGNNAA